MLRLVLLAAVIGLTLAGFCPPGEVPIGVKVTPDGPDIVCEKPACEIRHDRVYACSYYEASCESATSWVSGIHLPSKSLKVACCESPYIQHSRLIGQTSLLQGDSFTGGYFNDESGKEGFDAIFNLQPKGTGYKVTVTRVTCPTRASDFIKPEGMDAIEGVAANQIAANQRFTNPGLTQDFAPNIFSDNENFADPIIQRQEFLNQLPADPQPMGFPGPGPGMPALGGLGGLAGGTLCFSEDTTIQTETGTKIMKDLKVGDKVLSIEEGRYQYAPVTSFLHRHESKEAEFLDIKFGDEKLTMTPLHFIYTSSCDESSTTWTMKYAKDIVVGEDCLLRVVGDSVSQMTHKLTPVTALTPVVRAGYYGPMTTTGQIVVNDMIASCHAIVKDGTLLNSLMNMAQNMEAGVRKVKSWVGFGEDLDMNQEMPKSLENMLYYADAIFPETWKSVGQHN